VLAQVPVAWDETRCLAGEPGSQVVIARRAGPDWYVAGINGRADATTVGLDLADLTGPDGAWMLLGDDLTATHGPAAQLRSVTMAPYGGFLATTAVPAEPPPSR
jgi:hypothetical protein